ncbi:glutathione S-transferase family protein [Sphingobium sp.]|uniref:glutathione S-transferase family protein n=1 Tax=Sphingobium sp. TaxID=1912891 RepID=UPI002E1F2486
MATPPYRLYGAVTPNVGKVTALLEEIGASYDLVMIDVAGGEQHQPPFAAINPNAKVPVLEDREAGGLRLAESGAILLYLAEKHGAMLPADPVKRAVAYQWLMFQMSGIGPMLGQLRHFRMVALAGNDHALARYGDEAVRLFTVLNNQLQGQDFVADTLTIADFALYPWFHFIDIYRAQGIDFGLDPVRFPAIAQWQERCRTRPSMAKGMAVLEARLEEAIAALRQAGRWSDAPA